MRERNSTPVTPYVRTVRALPTNRGRFSTVDCHSKTAVGPYSLVTLSVYAPVSMPLKVPAQMV